MLLPPDGAAHHLLREPLKIKSANNLFVRLLALWFVPGVGFELCNFTVYVK
jgi:hypothetical protein